MITVHHLENSQSFRIVWLLEELSMDYELITYKRNKDDMMAPDSFKKISPLGTSPTITDGDDVILSESNAIIDYILDKAGGPNNSSTTPLLRPTSSSSSSSPAAVEERIQYLFWFHTAQGSLMPILNVDAVWLITCQKVPFIIRPLIKGVYKAVQKGYIIPRLEKIYTLAEKQLLEKTTTSFLFFAGGDNLTAADITLIYPIESSLLRYPHLAKEFPTCQKWKDQMHERPAFQAALKKVGDTNVVADL